MNAYNGSKINTIGSCFLKCFRRRKCINIKFLVVEHNVQTILGCRDSQRFGFIKVLENDYNKGFKTSKDILMVDVQNEFSDLFTGRGEMGKPLKIEIDETVTPRVHAPRRVPFTLMEPVKNKLEELVATGVLVKETEPTPWVSSLVVVQKPSEKLRICIDPTDLNKAVRRPHYPIPRVEEILTKLGKAKVFSILDAKDGFWQIPLSNESKEKTAF